MERDEVKSEPFEGYAEMPDEYKGDLRVVLYQDQDGRCYAQVKSLQPTYEQVKEERGEEEKVKSRVIADFFHVSSAFLQAVETFAKQQPRRVRPLTGSITWRDIVAKAKHIME